MQLIINLPNREEALAFHRERWAEVLADRELQKTNSRIETNEFGQIIMTPPAGGPHSSRSTRIAILLERLMGPKALTECPISTVAGVRAADSAWYSVARYETVRGQDAFEIAPEICVEVLSPSNSEAEMRIKRQLYFTAGAEECWVCDLTGRMAYYEVTAPETQKLKSTLCPHFPSIIED